MLTARLATLRVLNGPTSSQKLVTVGVAISEDDPSLAQKLVQGQLSWGDGTANVDIEAVASPYQQTVSMALSTNSDTSTVTLSRVAHFGHFTLVWNAVETDLLEPTATPARIKSALEAIGAVVLSVSGTNPSWIIRFVSSAYAGLLELPSSHQLGAYHEFTRVLPVGSFVVQLATQNLRSPEADESNKSLLLSLTGPQAAAQPSAAYFGPVLPADFGFPNATQWSFDVSTDIKILTSSVKMVLITNIGERVHVPEYGWRRDHALFDPNDAITAGQVELDIRNAITRWEPRVKVEHITLQRTERQLVVIADLLSLISQERWQATIEV